MLETIQKTCELLSSAPLTVQQVAAKLGTLVQGQGGGSGLIVQPNDKDFTTALIERRIYSDEPAYIQFSMADPQKLTVDSLHKKFGVWSELPNVNWNALQEIIFYVDLPGAPKTCAIIAYIEPGEQGLEDGTVVRLTVRRDARS